MKTLLDEPDQVTGSFESLEGSPTITFETESGQFLIPYFTITCARMNADATTINITCQDHTVELRGHGLLQLWRTFQLQNIRKIWIDPPRNNLSSTVETITITPIPQQDD